MSSLHVFLRCPLALLLFVCTWIPQHHHLDFNSPEWSYSIPPYLPRHLVHVQAHTMRLLVSYCFACSAVTPVHGILSADRRVTGHMRCYVISSLAKNLHVWFLGNGEGKEAHLRSSLRSWRFPIYHEWRLLLYRFFLYDIIHVLDGFYRRICKTSFEIYIYPFVRICRHK